MIRSLSLLLPALMLAGTAQADEVMARMKAAFVGAKVTAVAPSPVDGIYEVELNGVEQLYVSEDARYVFAGDLFEIRESGPVNLREERVAGVRAAGFKDVDEADMITFAAEQERAELYVFTDVTCGYCRRLHQQMGKYNALGITIHYLAFPRGGMETEGAQTMRAVWCAKDRQKAMTEAKLSGAKATPPENCSDPVAAQYRQGIDFEVRGTPAMFTASGRQLGGYVAPDELAEALGLKPAEAD